VVVMAIIGVVLLIWAGVTVFQLLLMSSRNL
jgi:hypothetical protein